MVRIPRGPAVQAVLSSVIPTAYREIGGPVAQKLSMLLAAGDYKSLMAEKFRPSDYEDAGSAQKAYHAIELVRKADSLPLGSDDERRAEAISRFDSAEAICAQTNKRLWAWYSGFGSEEPEMMRVIRRAQLIIANVLGPFSLEAMCKGARWSTGSDLSTKRPYTSSYHKYRAKPTLTRAVRPYLSALCEFNPTYSRWLLESDASGPYSPLNVRVIAGNRYSTVPKDALTFRSICVEPSVNVHLQLAVGTMIRRRLKRFGVDLNTQEWNQWLALWGSRNAFIGTIDLSSASDTVARVLVGILLDADSPILDAKRQGWVRAWMRVLSDLRSPMTRRDGAWYINSKFSSMGNGFTFELESLIFYALATATAEIHGGRCMAVFGDDIIVTSDVFDHVMKTLTFCGFSANAKKSFNSGNFRESCGMDAFNGIQLSSFRITSHLEPVDKKSDPDNVWVANLYSMHNGLRAIGCYKAAMKVLQLIPRRWRFFGPESAGDQVLHNGNQDTWKFRLLGRDRGWFFHSLELKCLSFKPEHAAVHSFEPALLHSWSASGGLDELPAILCNDAWAHLRTFGPQGLATLTRGEWRVSRTRVSTVPFGL